MAQETFAVIGGGLTGDWPAWLVETCSGSSRYRFVSNADTPEELITRVEAVDRSKTLLIAMVGQWLRDEGLALLIQVQQLSQNARVVLIGADLQTLALGQALRLGLRGLIEPAIDAPRLGKMLDVIASGELWISRQLLMELLGLMSPLADDQQVDVWLNLPSLTEREHEVLLHIVEGKPNKVIASSLRISEQTVKIHLQHVYRKLGVHRRVDLIRAFSELCSAA